MHTLPIHLHAYVPKIAAKKNIDIYDFAGSGGSWSGKAKICEEPSKEV